MRTRGKGGEMEMTKARKNTKKSLLSYFSITEYILWGTSMLLIILSFFLFDGTNYLAFAASLIGATAILLNAKGNPIGLCLMIIFGIIYTIISFSYAYYGEVATYLGMTTPMSAFSLIMWLKNPYNGNRAEVKINRVGAKEILVMLLVSIPVTTGFYFILKYFGTANILPSTISVTTSFIAVYLTARRSPLFSLAYALNDIVLIILWSLAAWQNPSYISVIVCFASFLANDIYAFINWQRIEKRQSKCSQSEPHTTEPPAQNI